MLNSNLSEIEKCSGPLGFHYKQDLLCDETVAHVHFITILCEI
jgi:hypothetical protein